MQNKARGYLDIQGSNKFVGFAVGEYNPSILINPVEKFLRLQFTDNDNQSKIYDYQLIGNADLRDIFSGRDNYIDTLSSIQQLTTPGFYKIVNISSAVNDNAGSNPLSDYATGDFYGLLMGTSMNSTNGCRYGTLVLTSPRLVGDLWVGNIWDYKFAGWYKK